MKDTSTTSRTTRRDRRIRERVHDPYKTRRKPKEPAVCPRCAATFHAGRWQWRTESLEGANEALCPACARIEDDYPAGRVTLTGPFSREHRDEILSLAKNQEAKAKGEHPLDRIMAIEEKEGAIVIKTTDTHLPRAIGEALHHAYQGELDYHYNEEEYFLGVKWSR